MLLTLVNKVAGYRLSVVELVLSSMDTRTVQQLSYQLMLHTDTPFFGYLLGNLNVVRASVSFGLIANLNNWKLIITVTVFTNVHRFLPFYSFVFSLDFSWLRIYHKHPRHWFPFYCWVDSLLTRIQKKAKGFIKWSWLFKVFTSCTWVGTLCEPC